jgi:hypothetical protein
VGIGDPLEAAATLAGPIPAGRWHLIGDGIVPDSVDITFRVIWRSAAGDQTLATWQNHFEAPPAGPNRYKAVRYEADADGVAAEAVEGDRLVLRFEAGPAASAMPFIPNGDGHFANGRIPSITLPR